MSKTDWEVTIIVAVSIIAYTTYKIIELVMGH